MKGLLKDTVRELLDRKMIWVYAVLVALAMLTTFGARAVEINIQGQNVDLTEMGEMLAQSAARGLNVFLYILVFFTVLGTAGLIPSMFIRGRADYFLSKPISRQGLILNKVISIWLVYSIVLLAAFALVAATIGIAFGYFDIALLWLPVFYSLTLFIWLSVTSLAGIWFGSNAMSLIAAFVVWLLQYLLSFHEWVAQLTSSKTVIFVVDMLYYIVPKTGQMSDAALALAIGSDFEWLPLWSSLLFAVALLVITIGVFRRKEF